MDRWSFAILNVSVGVGLALLVPSQARADKLSDFTEANKYNEGCSTIPVMYRSQREACEKVRQGQQEWCEGRRGPLSCGNLSDTVRPKETIMAAERTISELRDKKSRAESNRSSASTDDDKRKYDDEVRQLETAIRNTEKERDNAKYGLDNRGKLIAEAIYTIENCITQRKAAVYAFEEALDRMRNEKETPEIASVAESLAKKYYASIAGHKEMIRNLENALRDCRDWRP